jgi:integrase
MSLAVARHATDADHPLLAGYVEHLAAIGVSDRAERDRLRIARQFLAVHPDLHAWMARPLDGRLAELGRVKAWPLLCWAILAGRVQVDVDLLMAKELGHLARTAETIHDEDYRRLRATAVRLGWAPRWIDTVLRGCLTLIIATTGQPPARLTVEDLDDFRRQVTDSPVVSRSSRRAYLARLHSLQQLLFEARIVDRPPTRGPAAASVEARLEVIGTDEIRRTITRYVKTRTSVLAPKSIESLINDLVPFGTFLSDRFPELDSLRQLERHHVEAFLTWNAIERTWRGRKSAPRKVSPSVVHATVLSVRNFLDDITLWSWAERPTRRLLFPTDVPKLPRALPRALPPDVDRQVMAAIADIDDLPARVVLMLLRQAGLRIGEALDLELDAVVDYGPAGTWLRVPLGKLATDRSVPLDANTVALLDRWIEQRGIQRALPHPRGGRPTDFLFVQRGRRLGQVRVRNRLNAAVAATGLTMPDGRALTVTPHQLRHTFATELVNAGMSLQALMALLGHVTPEMTLRYATLASPTIRAAYDHAVTTSRRRLPIVVAGRPAPPSRVEWLHAEMLKTRLATGYCSLPAEAGACPYANICEHCENFMPAPQAAGILQAQLADVRLLHADAEQRGWEHETHRHAATIDRLEGHLAGLARTHPRDSSRS